MLLLILQMSRFRFLNFSTNTTYIVNFKLYYLKYNPAHLFHKVGPKVIPSQGWAGRGGKLNLLNSEDLTYWFLWYQLYTLSEIPKLIQSQGLEIRSAVYQFQRPQSSALVSYLKVPQQRQLSKPWPVNNTLSVSPDAYDLVGLLQAEGRRRAQGRKAGRRGPR